MSSTSSATLFDTISAVMQRDGQPEIAIRSFAALFEQLKNPGAGLISENQIEPVEALPSFSTLPTPESRRTRSLLAKTVVLKLNGGLGTGMGLAGPKSLLPVKGDLTFLDVLAKQIAFLREKHQVQIPLLLMNSFSTRAPSLERLQRYPQLLLEGLALDFLQHRVPKLWKDTLEPVTWPANPILEWCPPGHGDLYAAIVSSGTLASLRQRGYRYAFISNSDNLGATLDPAILAYLADRQLPFLMEVTARTDSDRKGGHLARRRQGSRLLLRESAQCPAEDQADFQNIQRHRFFNTNNLWVDLEALAALIDRQGCVPLPLIRNEKTVNPADLSTPPVLQLESAMGAAIESFEGAEALDVPRSRFAPVKQCLDLLAVWSDAYTLNQEMCIVLDPSRQGRPPVVKLDSKHYRVVDDLLQRFPHGAPSLVQADCFEVRGDVRFGRGIRALGNVVIESLSADPVRIPDGAVLKGRVVL